MVLENGISQYMHVSYCNNEIMHVIHNFWNGDPSESKKKNTII